MAPIRPAGVCLAEPAKREGLDARGKLAAVDPLRGDTLWTMAFTDTEAHLLADDRHLYLVEAPSRGSPVGPRAVSVRDGAVRDVRTNQAGEGELLQAVGRNLLIRLLPAVRLGRNDGRLALYDPLAGKDVWGVPLAPGTLVARSKVPH